MKRLLVSTLFLICFHVKAQQPLPVSVLCLYSPFDARSAGMGDVQVATSPNAFSVFENVSKTAYMKEGTSLGIAYSPWMSTVSKAKLFSAAVTYNTGDKKKDGFTLSMKYLNFGQLSIKDENGNATATTVPSELVVGASYSIGFSDQFGMGLTFKYIRSDNGLAYYNSSDYQVNSLKKAGNAFAADWGGTYYFSDVLSTGWMFENLGTKINTNGKNQFLPMNLRLGATYYILGNSDNNDAFSSSRAGRSRTPLNWNVSLDINKLLIPTPPLYDSTGTIIKGQNPEKSVPEALATSFVDAPGGFSEEIKEYALSLGSELIIDEMFAIRAGTRLQSASKSTLRYATLGFGFQNTLFNSVLFNVNLSYQVPFSKTNNSGNLFRISLCFNFDN